LAGAFDLVAEDARHDSLARGYRPPDLLRVTRQLSLTCRFHRWQRPLAARQYACGSV